MAGRVLKIISSWLRVFVIGLDAFFALVGFLTLLLAIICYATPHLHEFSHALNKVISVNMLFIGTMVVGLVFMIVGGIGCYGALTRNPFYLGIHIGVMLVMYMFQAAIVYAFRREWEEKLSLGVSFGVMNYHPDDPQRRYMDGIQRVLDCCGGASPLDYRFNIHYDKRSVPLSCCASRIPRNKVICDKTKEMSIPIQYANQMGCRSRLRNLLWPSILGIVIGLGSLGFCCILFPSLYIYVQHIITEDEDNEDSEDGTKVDKSTVDDAKERTPLISHCNDDDSDEPLFFDKGIQVSFGNQEALDQLQALAQRLTSLELPQSPIKPGKKRINSEMFFHNADDNDQKQSSRRIAAVPALETLKEVPTLRECYPKLSESIGQCLV